MKFINIGFGNMVSAGRIVAIAGPDSAPIKRLVQDAKEDNRVIDVSCGRRTRAVIITDSEHVILSAIQAETITNRLTGGDSSDDEEPICDGQNTLTGFNDLVTINPDLATQWHPNKNGNLKPCDVRPSSNKKVWWICEKGHEWEAVIGSRSKGVGCPVCANKKTLAGYNDLATTNPSLAAQWHPTRNADLHPTDVTRSSNKKVWWICQHGHEWQSTVSHRNQGRGCPKCSRVKCKK